MTEEPHNLNTDAIAGVFSNTSATYKYFWMLALLELNSDYDDEIPIQAMFAKMISLAWYPIHYFRLSFGKNDLLAQKVFSIHQHAPLTFPVKEKLSDLYSALAASQDPFVLQELFHFESHVVFRFLTPWVGAEQSNAKMASHSLQDELGAPYRIFRDKQTIEVRENWRVFFTRHKQVLREFTYWELCLFLQKRNPNVPDIPNKLIKPITRNNLTKHKKVWDAVMPEFPVHLCMFTQTQIGPQSALDHFIPWSFVAHDQFWNLVPISQTANSSKSDRIPDLGFYLKDLMSRQQIALRWLLGNQPSSSFLEEFQIAFDIAPGELAEADLPVWEAVFRTQMDPMVQIATNMGFQNKWRYPHDLSIT